MTIYVSVLFSCQHAVSLQRIICMSASFLLVFQETVNVFLSWKNTDEADLEGRTAFMWAAGKGADDVLRVFFHHSVDVQQEDKTGGTGQSPESCPAGQNLS